MRRRAGTRPDGSSAKAPRAAAVSCTSSAWSAPEARATYRNRSMGCIQAGRLEAGLPDHEVEHHQEQHGGDLAAEGDLALGVRVARCVLPLGRSDEAAHATARRDPNEPGEYDPGLVEDPHVVDASGRGPDDTP